MKKALVIAGVATLAAVIFCAVTFKIITIEGNEMGVHETWDGGVQPDPLQAKTWIFVPGFRHSVYKYDMSSQVYVMNDAPMTSEFGEGREKGSYQVQSKEGQDLHISMNIRWRLDPEKLVFLHKTVRDHFAEKVLRPTLLRIVKDEATTREAITAYSGPGLVELQSAIQKHLTDPNGEIRRQGILVENFVIEGIILDADYIGEIRAKQVAVQRELRAVQEEKAALAVAQKAKAEARADYEKVVVEAERDKQVGILKAEEKAQMQVLAAEAEKQKQVLASEGEKQASVNRAQAILAMGEAEAAAKKLQFAAYSESGAKTYANIEISKNMAVAFQGIKGYLPSDMNITLLSTSFLEGVKNLVDNQSSAGEEKITPAQN